MADDNYDEAVIKDNEFHRQLSGVRNLKNMQNHPDVELMLLEQKRKAREQQIEQTLSGVFAQQDIDPTQLRSPRTFGSSSQNLPSTEPGQHHLDDGHSLPPSGAETGPLPQVRHAATQLVQLNTGIYDDVASSIFSFQHCMEQIRKESKRAKRFNRPMSVCILAFHELNLIKEKLGSAAYEKAVDFIGDLLGQTFDLDIDVIGRYSSDKFILVLPEVTGAGVKPLMDSIRASFLEHPITFKQFRFNLKASIGIVFFPDHGIEWRELIAKADLVADMLVEQGGNAVATMPLD